MNWEDLPEPDKSGAIDLARYIGNTADHVMDAICDFRNDAVKAERNRVLDAIEAWYADQMPTYNFEDFMKKLRSEP